jgi:quercetin dioxygenase-like cupin family protein
MVMARSAIAVWPRVAHAVGPRLHEAASLAYKKPGTDSLAFTTCSANFNFLQGLATRTCSAVRAGPIWNNAQADTACPGECSKVELTWNRQWTTTQPGVIWVCGRCLKHGCRHSARSKLRAQRPNFWFNSAVPVFGARKGGDSLNLNTPWFCNAVVAGLFLVAGPGAVSAQDPAVVNADLIRVTLENDRVRVFEAVIEPGQREQPHSHPATVIHVVAGGRVRNHIPGGLTSEAEFLTGTTVYREPLVHWVENIGDTTIRVIVVELKDPGRAMESSK